MSPWTSTSTPTLMFELLFTLLLHDGLRRIKLPKCLNPFSFIDDTITPNVYHLEHIPHDTEWWECFVRHLTHLVDELTKLSECYVTHAVGIECPECILRRQQVVV